MPSEHAILSASSSHRWLSCTPSARLEQEFKETESIVAKEGTAAHALAEHKLKLRLKMQTERPVSEFQNQEMEDYTEDYADYVFEHFKRVKRYDKNAKLLVEQRLDFSCYVPDGFGTGDAIIVSHGRLQIIDLKYGLGVLVKADHNPQMMLYALGALKRFEREYQIKKVKMTIFQPRRENIDTWETTTFKLKKWADKVLRPKAEQAYKGTGDYEPGAHCQFCKAAATCRARAMKQLELAKQEFKEPALLSDAEMDEILLRIPQLKKWIEEIWTYATDKAVSGKSWNGFKLVEGRSNRKYKDEKEVINAANKAGYEDIYKKTLLSVSEMEKLMGKKTFCQVLGGLVIKPEGKPTLVEESDPRKAMNTNNANSEFTTFKEEK